MRFFEYFLIILLLVEIIAIIVTLKYLYSQCKLTYLNYKLDCLYKDNLITEDDYLHVKELYKNYVFNYHNKKLYLELMQSLKDVLNRSSNNPQA